MVYGNFFERGIVTSFFDRNNERLQTIRRLNDRSGSVTLLDKRSVIIEDDCLERAKQTEILNNRQIVRLNQN